MKLKIITTVGLTLLIALITGCSGASVMDTKVSSKQARIIFDVPKTVDTETLTKALYDSVSIRVSDLTESEGLMPEVLPDTPAGPTQNQGAMRLMAMTGGGNASMSMMALDTSNSYYWVMGKGKSESEYMSRSESYKAAIYPYKDGYKIYMYLFYTEGTDGILGNLTSAAVNSIVGQDGAILFIAQARDQFMKEVPSAKVLSQSPQKLNNVNLNAIGWSAN